MTRTRTITLTLGSLAAGAVLATGVSGLALADDRGGQGTPGQSAMGNPGHHEGMHGPGRGMHGPGDRMGEPLHGELVVKADDGTISTVRTIHGTVTAVSADSITVKAEDGYSATFAVTADTDVRVGPPDRGGRHSEDPSTASTDAITDVKVGDTVHVDGKVSGSTATASHVHVRPSEAPQTASSTQAG